MARRKSTEGNTLDMGPLAYRYSPGDGHTYTWDGGEYATVWRHRIKDGPEDGPTTGLLFDPTNDHVYMAGCARTASAFMDHVDAWRKR